jgi:prepilin-type processing-associated H-X9-DG protein/prepilin-type N-terminal cleavage/methylation domain-containing protein
MLVSRRQGRSAFTLVELLVVIGIIALLISILLPALSKARASSVSLSCKSLLRQYALACEMYLADNRGVAVDVYKYLDYAAGLPKYFSAGAEMPEKIARCPGDNDVRLGLLGAYSDAGDPTRDYKIRRADGTEYTVQASIGANISPLSASLATSKSGKLAPRWVKPNHLRVPGWDPSRVMVWGDWQNNPQTPTPMVPVIKPTAKDNMGTLRFRHNGAANAVFFDGHVAQIRATVPLTSDHGDLAPGTVWTGDTFTMNHYQLFYPFGPGFHGTRVEMRGDFPGITIE